MSTVMEQPSKAWKAQKAAHYPYDYEDTEIAVEFWKEQIILETMI